MYIDTLGTNGVYYYCLATVDLKGNISDLSDTLKFELT